ncbi:MAG: universal stress protein, partial [Bacteroidota bacterium]
MQKILLPIDLSPASENAIDFIVDVFGALRPHLHLIHVKRSDENLEEIKELFKQFEENKLIPSRLNYQFEITKKGGLLSDIQSTIEAESPDLLVLGTRGINGSTLSKALVKIIDCPVMLVPENYKETKVKRIAYANDFYDIKNSAALKPLMNLAMLMKAKVYLLHINRDNRTSDNAEASLEYYLDYVDHEYVCITSEDVEQSIMNFIKEKKIDILTVLL